MTITTVEDPRMRHLRPIAAILVAVGLALSMAGLVLAKEGAVATLDEPLPTDPVPGSTITVSWTLDMPDGKGGTFPFDSEGVFIRFTPPTGAPLEVEAKQPSLGHYVATLTVPKGGLGSPVFGLKGEACYAGKGCQRSDMYFALAKEPHNAAPAAVVRPVAPVTTSDPAAEPPVPAPAAVTTTTQTAPAPAAATTDLTLLPLVALVGLAVAGIALAIRGRQRAAAA